MSATRDDFALAAMLCSTDIERLYHWMMLRGLEEQASDVRSVDKGKLIASIVTRGVQPEALSPGEVTLIVLACLREVTADGSSVSELMRLIKEARGHRAAQDVLRRAREGAKP